MSEADKDIFVRDEPPRNRRKTVIIVIVLLLLVALGYFAYTRMQKKPDDKAAHAMPPAPVSVIEAKSEDIPLTYQYAGRTAGSRETEIRARVSGILLERTYLEGSTVKEGDILFKIDPATFDAELTQARARMVLAERNWKRIGDLYKSQAVSGSDRDAAQSEYEQAKGAFQNAQINKDWTIVRAPISGVTSREGMSEGSLIVANTSLLTRISQLDPMYVNFAYPDSDILNQRSGVAGGGITLPENGILMADIVMGNGSTYNLPAPIDFTDTIIDPTTGTVRARAVVPNPEGKIIPGQFVRVIVKGIVKKNAFALPPQAVLQGPQGQFVYVVTQDNKASIRPVTVGMLNGDKQIIESGLQNGDRVITEGMIKVRPDAVVAIVEPKAADANASPAAPVQAENKGSENKTPETKTPKTKTEPAAKDEKAAAPDTAPAPSAAVPSNSDTSHKDQNNQSSH